MKNLPKPDVSNLSYNPETGILTFVKRVGNRLPGTEAGCLGKSGYRRIKINGVSYLSQRIACWLMGEDPTGFEVDHINGITDDNSWSNLRMVTRSVNQQNRKSHRSGRCPFTYYCNNLSRWVVEKKDIGPKGNRKRYGHFKTESQAIKCVKENNLLRA